MPSSRPMLKPWENFEAQSGSEIFIPAICHKIHAIKNLGTLEQIKKCPKEDHHRG
jgi:hypothetical protein